MANTRRMNRLEELGRVDAEEHLVEEDAEIFVMKKEEL